MICPHCEQEIEPTEYCTTDNKGNEYCEVECPECLELILEN